MIQLDHLALGVGDLLRRGHHLVPHGGHLRPVVLREDGGHDVAAECGPGLAQEHGGRIDGELGAVRGEAGEDLRRDARQEGPAHHGAAAEEDLGLLLHEDLRHQLGLHVLVEVADGRVVDHPDLVHAVGEKLVGVLPHAVSHQDGAHGRGELLLQLARGADDLGHHGGQLAPAVLGEHADARSTA